MIKVGLTGGIGSGKTTVSLMFNDLGIPVYYSDREAKRLMVENPEVRKAIVQLLGEKAFLGQRLNKTYISQRVFNDRPLLEKLNSIVHPAVRTDFLKWIKLQQTPYVVQETALIFEIGSQNFYDKIVLVVAPENIRIDRILERDPKSNRERIVARMRNQRNDFKKIKLSDYVIENLDLSRTRADVLRIHQELMSI